MTHRSETTSGIVLAGGLARRMGGGDKPLRLLAGRPILSHVVQRVAPQCGRLLLNANGDPYRFSSFGLPVVPDEVMGFAGPLAGVLAGLDHLAATDPTLRWAVSVAGDTPFVPPDLVEALHQTLRTARADLACASSGGRRHWVVALWPIDLRHALRAYLVGEGQRKVSGFMARHRIAEAEWPADPFDPFFNLNAPDDFFEAERIAQLAALPGA